MPSLQALKQQLRDSIAARSKGSERRTVFKTFDTSGDGLITFEEFKVGVDKVYSGLTDDALHSLFEDFDIDGTGALTKEELCQCILNPTGSRVASYSSGAKHNFSTTRKRGKLMSLKRSQAVKQTEREEQKSTKLKILSKMLKEAILAKTTGSSERRTIAAAFRRIDLSGDGKLTQREFQLFVSQFMNGLSQNDVHLLFSSFDKGGSGTIAKEVFVTALLGEEAMPVASKSTSSTQELEYQAHSHLEYDDEDEIEEYGNEEEGVEKKTNTDNALGEEEESLLARVRSVLASSDGDWLEAEKKAKAQKKREKEARIRKETFTGKAARIRNFKNVLRAEIEKQAISSDIRQKRVVDSATNAVKRKKAIKHLLLSPTERLSYKTTKDMYKELARRYFIRCFQRNQRDKTNQVKRAAKEKEKRERKFQKFPGSEEQYGKRGMRFNTPYVKLSEMVVDPETFLEIMNTFTPPGFSRSMESSKSICGLSSREVEEIYVGVDDGQCAGSFKDFVNYLFPVKAKVERGKANAGPELNRFGFAVSESRTESIIKEQESAGTRQVGALIDVQENPFDYKGKGERFIMPPKPEDIPDKIVYRFSKTPVCPPSAFDPRLVTRSALKPAASLEREWIHGYQGKSESHYQNIFQSSEGELVYYVAAVVVVYDPIKRMQRYFDMHTDDVTSLTVDRKGMKAASGQTGKLPFIYVWSLSTLLPSHRIGLGEYTFFISCMQFDNSATKLAAVGADNKHILLVWDLLHDTYPRKETAKKLKRLREACNVPEDALRDPNPVNHMGGAPKTKLGLGSSTPELNRGKLIYESTCGNGKPPMVLGLGFAPRLIETRDKEKKRLVVTVGVNHINFFYISLNHKDKKSGCNTGSCRLGRFNTYEAPRQTYCVDFVTPNAGQNMYVITGGSDGNIYFWRTDAQCISVINAHKNGCFSLHTAWNSSSKDTCEFFSGGGDNTVSRWRVTSKTSNNKSMALCIGSKKLRRRKEVMKGAGEHSMRIENAFAKPVKASSSSSSSGKKKKNLSTVNQKNPSTVNQKFCVKALSLISFNGDDSVDLYAGTGENQIWSVKISPTRIQKTNQIVKKKKRVTSLMGSLSLADADSTFSEVIVAGHSNVLRALSSMHGPFNHCYLTAGEDAVLNVWDRQSHNRLNSIKLPAAATCLHCCPRNNSVAIGFSNGGVILVELVSSSENSRIPHFRFLASAECKTFAVEAIEEVRFSPDGRQLAVGSRDNVIYIFDTSRSRLQLHGKLRGHTSYVTHLDWSADSRVLQSNCGAYNIIYWDPHRCKPLSSTRDTVEADTIWDSWTCVLGFPVLGIWPDFR
eukprot:g368.t1